MEEEFDLCDERGRLLGQSKPRSLVHQDGDWHRAFHCWIFDAGHDGEVRILLQLRALDKDTCPGLWDVSVGGHYSAGESLEGGLREIREELGLEAKADELVHAARRHDIAFHPNGLIDREVEDVFFLRWPLDLQALRPDLREVAAVAIVPGEELLKLAAGRRGSLTVPGGRVRPSGRVWPQEQFLTPASLVPHQDRYYARAVLLARRLIAGRPAGRRRWW